MVCVYAVDILALHLYTLTGVKKSSQIQSRKCRLFYDVHQISEMLDPSYPTYMCISTAC